jgi:PKHD-type hydroxylase
MFLEIKDLLNPAEVQRLRDIAGAMNFVDGRASNPTSTVKQNLQADQKNPLFAESSNIVMGALMRSPAFQNFTFPQRIAPPMLTRYEPGMRYGAHADSAFLPAPGAPMRSDISVTVFINDPASYQGGELAVQLGTRESLFKGPPGYAIVYPSTTLHEVKPVTQGQRLCAITFMQSQIADTWQRFLLYELNDSISGADLSPEARARFDVVTNNLWRMWSSS